MEEELLFGMFVLVLASLPFVLPIASWVSARRTRARVEELEGRVDIQRDAIAQLNAIVRTLRDERAAGATAPAAERPAAVTPRTPEIPTPAVRPPEAEPPPQPPPQLEPLLGREPQPQPPLQPRPELGFEPPTEEEPEPAEFEAEEPLPSEEPVEEAPALAAEPAAEPEPEPEPVRVAAYSATPPPPPPPPEEPAPAAAGFDWEGLVGVKLFSAVAGIALVFAAVFFLRYSIEAGWLQPPVRVAIGVLVAISLLVVCEMKAARRYPSTANALDAAAIAILFATFFAAHALWNLIPAALTFALLAIVTALAVLLSIRRESLFIAVLGLLGGFSTPALLSTGENRPIPLFAYLLLLNVGLAWVAHQKAWPVLTWLTLILTTIYQWGWVLKFLHESSLSLAMGVFIVFPIASIVGVILARRSRESGDTDADGLEPSTLISAALPVLFAAYLAAVPRYGENATLLFGFLLLLDAGLLAIALARRQELMHAVGAVATVLTMGIWLAMSYQPVDSRMIAIGFTAAFSLFYLCAPVLAERLGRRFSDVGAQATFGAPLLLFVFPVLGGMEAAFAEPWPLFVPLLLLVIAIAWRAMASGMGSLYYTASFFAVAAQAVWSARHLTGERLGTAVALYALFGLVSLAVPVIARRRERPLEPAWGGGVVLLLSLGLLLFLSTGPIAGEALWALALLLAILNAALFIESAAGGLPLLSQAGSVFSWLILATWWARAAGTVGVLPSLAVLTGLTLITLGGHAWAVRAQDVRGEADAPLSFGQGLYLGLAGHLFLLFLALNREWAIPPWPVFGALAVITLATSAAALAVRAPELHVAGTIAASIVVAAWGAAAGSPPWGMVLVLSAAAVSAYALFWISLSRARFDEIYARGAVAVLFVAELAVILAAGEGAAPPFAAVVLSHVATISVVLALTARYSWRFVALGAIAPAWLAVLQWQSLALPLGAWQQVLMLSGALYVVLVAYPMIIGRSRPDDREPYIVAILASAMFFFAAHQAFTVGGLESIVGIVPVVEAAVLVMLLRQLLASQPSEARDMGRLALVAGAALAFVTVAIPVQLDNQWRTVGWALEGAALAWLYRRIPHRGLLYSSVALLAVVFVRLAANPDVFEYEPRGEMRILNWYLYTYLICAVSTLLAAWWLSRTDEEIADGWPRPSQILSAAGVILLFVLLNIEIADFYATEPTIAFRFGVTVSQDLTYTIGWLVFGILLLAAGIYINNRAARVAAVALIAVTTLKCFLYDLKSLEGLPRVASFVGLAFALALVSLALQKYVLSKPRGAA